MYTKLTAVMVVAALSAILITSATIALSEDADARGKKRSSQNIEQSNKNCGQCANAASEIDGNGNNVGIAISISK